MAVVLDDFIINIMASTEGLKKGIEAARTELRKLGILQEETGKIRKENEKLTMSYRDLLLTFRAVLDGIDQGVETYKGYTSQMHDAARASQSPTDSHVAAADSARGLSDAYASVLIPNLASAYDMLDKIREGGAKLTENQKTLADGQNGLNETVESGASSLKGVFETLKPA